MWRGRCKTTLLGPYSFMPADQHALVKLWKLWEWTLHKWRHTKNTIILYIFDDRCTWLKIASPAAWNFKYQVMLFCIVFFPQYIYLSIYLYLYIYIYIYIYLSIYLYLSIYIYISISISIYISLYLYIYIYNTWANKSKKQVYAK